MTHRIYIERRAQLALGGVQTFWGHPLISIYDMSYDKPDVTIAPIMGRGVENPGKFILLVEWERMDAHIAFGKAPVGDEFRALVGRFSKGGSMEHFKMG